MKILKTQKMSTTSIVILGSILLIVVGLIVLIRELMINCKKTKTNLLKMMLRNKDIDYTTYLKYL